MISPNHNLDRQKEQEEIAYLFEQLAPFQKLKQYKKNELVIASGEVSNKLLYVHKGVLRTYRLNEKFEEVTSGFTFPGDFDIVAVSFFTRTIAKENIISLTNSEVIQFNYHDIITLLSTNPKVAQITFAYLSKYIETLELRLFDMRNGTAAQQYHKLRNLQPDEIDLIPDHTLASYLGITKERMSRIKNDKS